MKDSADIRKVNRHKIFTILWYGGQFSKQQLSVQTGLSIATCNTLLNEMEQAKEVIGEKKRLQDVGRETVCYKINEAYESFLCINFEVLNDMRYFTIHLLSPVGTIIEKVEKQFAILDYPAIASEVEHLLENHKNVSQILIGIPGIAKNGIIRHSDIDELENIALVSLLEKKFHIPVHMENDMHYKAYGYYCKHGKEDEIVTFAYFPTGILPGTASVHGGMIIKGRDHFAGMPGVLPFDTNRDELPALLHKETCRPFVSRTIASIITLINPGTIVFTGDLLDKDSLLWIREDCMQYIPEEYMPDFIYEDDFNSYYLAGMYHKALDLKGVI